MDSSKRETNEMFNLGEAVFLEGIRKLEEYRHLSFINHRNQMIIKKRRAVVEFINGLAEQLISQGWQFVGVLPSGRVVVGK